MNDEKPLKIKCLKALPSALCAAKERHLLKSLETLCVIKSIFEVQPMRLVLRNGKYVPDASEVLEVAKVSIRSPRQIHRRIERLRSIGWLREDTWHYLHAISWDELREKYSIRHAHFYHITPCENVQPEYLIKGKVIAEKQALIYLGYKITRKQYRDQCEVIKQVSGSLSPEHVAKHQLLNFLSDGAGYDEECQSALSMRYRKRETKMLNGDLEFNYRTGTRIFGYQSYGGYAKLKRALVRKGVIDVAPRREVVPNGIARTKTDRRNNRLGFVWYDPDLKTKFLIRPDAITVIPNVHVDQQFKIHENLRNSIAAKLAA